MYVLVYRIWICVQLFLNFILFFVIVVVVFAVVFFYFGPLILFCFLSENTRFTSKITELNVHELKCLLHETNLKVRMNLRTKKKSYEMLYIFSCVRNNDFLTVRRATL